MYYSNRVSNKFLVGGALRTFKAFVVCERFFHSIQGKDMLICEKCSHFRPLWDDIRRISDIKGLLQGMDILTRVSEMDVAAEEENYLVGATAVRVS